VLTALVGKKFNDSIGSYDKDLAVEANNVGIIHNGRIVVRIEGCLLVLVLG
jgi:hypothetical protein